MNLKNLILFMFAFILIFFCTGKKSEAGNKNGNIPETPELAETIALDTSAEQEIVFTSIPDFYNFYMEFSKSSAFHLSFIKESIDKNNPDTQAVTTLGVIGTREHLLLLEKCKTIQNLAGKDMNAIITA